MYKTPGQVASQMFATTSNFDEIAAAVIAHVTPQIRAAAIEDAIIIFQDWLHNSLSADLVEKLRALANLPSSHVCVPVDLLDKIDRNAEAGLCYFTLESAREFLKDIRSIIAAAKEPQ